MLLHVSVCDLHQGARNLARFKRKFPDEGHRLKHVGAF